MQKHTWFKLNKWTELLSRKEDDDKERQIMIRKHNNGGNLSALHKVWFVMQCSCIIQLPMDASIKQWICNGCQEFHRQDTYKTNSMETNTQRKISGTETSIKRITYLPVSQLLQDWGP